METPTLSKKQKKLTLSAKKSRPKETIKNVLATPYSSYWPKIAAEDHGNLKLILEKNLPKVCEKVQIAWRDMQNIPKADRKKFRDEYRKNNNLVINKEERNGLIIGINDVTKSLEANNVSVILISEDVQPRLMVQHVIDQAVLNRSPVIVFSGLRSLLRNVCGVGSTVIGIHKSLPAESKLNIIKECVVQCYKYCPPFNHINYNRSLENEKLERNDDCIVTNYKPKTVENKINEEQIRQSVYLKRVSNHERAFVPEISRTTSENDKMDVNYEGFLAFTGKPILKHIQSSYKSLTVKRLKGDPNRDKRKINSLKRKRK